MTLLRTAAISVATAAFVLAPTAAHAGTYHRSDAAHDIVKLSDDSDTTTPVPDRSNGDILASGVTYGARRVTMTMKFAALGQVDTLVEHYFSVVTNKGKIRQFFLIAEDGKWEGSVKRETGRGKHFTCRGVHWSIKYAAGTATLSVPARCLGKPRWVRVSMAEAAIGDMSGDSTPIFLDDSSATGFSGDSDPKYGPRVYR